MSRSYLRNKWMKQKIRQSFSKADSRNQYSKDEMPKNRASKLIINHCSADVEWLDHPGSFGGHKPRKGGHRRVSGLVRASLKTELHRHLKEEFVL